MNARTRKATAKRAGRRPVLASFLVHATILLLLWQFASVAAAPRKIGEFRSEVVAEAPPLPEPPAYDPPPPDPSEEVTTVVLDEPPPEDLEPPAVDSPPPFDLAAPIELSVPTERCMAARPLPRRRRVEAAPAAAPRPVAAVVRRPVGPTRRASPLTGNPAPRYPTLLARRAHPESGQ